MKSFELDGGDAVVESGALHSKGERDAEAAKTVNPSFVLMDVAGDKLVAYVYELEDGEVKVDKIEHSKSVPPDENA